MVSLLAKIPMFIAKDILFLPSHYTAVVLDENAGYCLVRKYLAFAFFHIYFSSSQKIELNCRVSSSYGIMVLPGLV